MCCNSLEMMENIYLNYRQLNSHDNYQAMIFMTNYLLLSIQPKLGRKQMAAHERLGRKLACITVLQGVRRLTYRIQ